MRGIDTPTSHLQVLQFVSSKSTAPADTLKFGLPNDLATPINSMHTDASNSPIMHNTDVRYLANI
jgi:hypothetical protein